MKSQIKVQLWHKNRNYRLSGVFFKKRIEKEKAVTTKQYDKVKKGQWMKGTIEHGTNKDGPARYKL